MLKRGFGQSWYAGGENMDGERRKASGKESHKGRGGGVLAVQVVSEGRI